MASEVLARHMGHGELPGEAANLSREVMGLYRDGEEGGRVPEIPGYR